MTIVKDFISVFGSRIIIIICGLGYSIITARCLGPEDNGIIKALSLFPSIFMVFGSLGIRQSTAFITGQNKYKEDEIKSSILKIWFYTSIISVICTLLLIKLFSSNSENNIRILLAIIPIPFVLFNTYSTGIFLGKNEMKEFSRINWIPSFLILIGSFIFLIINNLGINGALTAAALGHMFVTIYLFWKYKYLKYFNRISNFIIIKKLISLGIVYSSTLLVINLNYKIDIFLLDRMSTPYEIGIYSKGATLNEYLWQIPMMLSTIVFARSSNAKDSKLFSLKVCHLLRVSIILISILSIFLYLFSDFIIITLFGKEFIDSINIQKVLLPGVLLLTIFKVLNMDLAGQGKPWLAIIAMLPALVINIVLNLIWIPKYGALGSAISSLISYSVASFIFLIVYSRFTQISVGHIFDFKRSDFMFFLNYIRTLR